MLHLSRGVFGADFGAVASVIQNRQDKEAKGTYFRLVERTFQEFEQLHLRMLFEQTLANHDFKYRFKDYTKEVTELPYSEDGNRIYYPNVSQKNFEKIPGSPIGYWVSEKMLNCFNAKDNIGNIANPRKGLATTDNKRFLRHWSEISFQFLGIGFKNKKDAEDSFCKWFPLNKGGEFRKWYGNNYMVVNWYHDGAEMKEAIIKTYKGGSYTKEIRSEDKYFKDCITWNALTSGTPSFRYSNYGALFDSAGSSMFPKEEQICPLLGILNSPIAKLFFDIINPTLNYGAGTIGSLPIVDIHIDEKLVSQNISISRSDWDAHETSWDFQRNELLTIDEATYADNIQYQIEKHEKETGEKICIDPAAPELGSLAWRMEQYKLKWEKLFMQLHANEEELNRQFIDIYGLQDELTPDVPLDEVTILQQGEISIE